MQNEMLLGQTTSLLFYKYVLLFERTIMEKFSLVKVKRTRTIDISRLIQKNVEFYEAALMCEAVTQNIPTADSRLLALSFQYGMHRY